MNYRLYALAIIGLVATVAGCGKKSHTPAQLEGASKHDAFRMTAGPLGRSVAEGTATLVEPTDAELRSMILAIAPDTQVIDPALSYIRANFDQVIARGGLDFLAMSTGALTNPEIIRLLQEKYESERSLGRYWRGGVFLIGRTGSVKLAEELATDWQNLPVYVRPAKMGWGDYAQQADAPRYSMAMAIFDSSSEEAIGSLWRSFSMAETGDQLLVAKAAGMIVDPFIAANLIKNLPLAKTEEVRANMVASANRILFHAISNVAPNDRAWLLETAGPILLDMEKRGLVRDDLAKIALHRP